MTGISEIYLEGYYPSVSSSKKSVVYKSDQTKPYLSSVNTYLVIKAPFESLLSCNPMESMKTILIELFISAMLKPDSTLLHISKCKVNSLSP